MTTWLRTEDCRLEEFRALTEQRTQPGDYPHADGTEQDVLAYDSRVTEGTGARFAHRRLTWKLRAKR